MSIRFNCDNAQCGKAIAVPDGTGGKKVKCRHCGKVQFIPTASTIAGPAGESPAAPASPTAASSPTSPATGGVFSSASAAGGKAGKIRQYYPDTRQKYSAEAGNTRRYVKIGVWVTILAGLIALAAIFIPMGIAKSRKALDVYYNPVFETKHIAERTVAQSNLNNVRYALQIWHNTHGGYPNSLNDLVQEKYLEVSNLRPHTSDGQPYEYIAGQTDESDPANILVYEPTAVRDMHNIIRRDLTIEMVTPEQLVKDFQETKRRLGIP